MTFFHAIWDLLNLVLIVGAFVIAYRSYRIFSERFGHLPSGLLILVIVGTCSGSRNKAIDKPSGTYKATIYSTDARPYKRDIVLYGDNLFRITQSISIDPVPDTDSLQLQSTVSARGLVLGTRWEPAQTVVGLLSGRQAFYQSTGSLTWYLLGVPVYTQWKRFEGETPLDEL